MNDARIPIPAEVRRAVMVRCKGRCEECGESPVELHHLTYYSQQPAHQYKFPKHAEAIFGFERPDDLLALCRDCHKDKHIGPAGDFIADPEECEAEWEHWNHLIEGEHT